VEVNPYEAPRANEGPGDAALSGAEAPTYRLYSPQQIGLGAFLGAPIAACWFLARNYRHLGNDEAANQSLVWGTLSTIAILAICFFLPDGFPNQLIPIAYTVGLLQLAKKLQGDAVAKHIAAGGRLGSSWEVAGVGLLCLVVILAIIFGVVFFILPVEQLPAGDAGPV
jgi:hypothetical protein